MISEVTGESTYFDLVDYVESVCISFIRIVDSDECSDDTRCITCRSFKSVAEVQVRVWDAFHTATEHDEASYRDTEYCLAIHCPCHTQDMKSTYKIKIPTLIIPT